MFSGQYRRLENVCCSIELGLGSKVGPFLQSEDIDRDQLVAIT